MAIPFISAVCAALCVPATADIGDEIVVGARAMGMGGAFTALACDATAVRWNPAGLSTVQRQEIAATYTRRFTRDETYLSYVLPLGESQALGLDWFRSSFADDELAYRTGRFSLAYGHRPSADWLGGLLGGLALGVHLRRASQDTDLDGQSLMRGSAWAANLGVVAIPAPRFRVGITLRNLWSTEVEHDSGLREDLLEPGVRLGLGYAPLEGLTVAADVGDALHLGAEYWVLGHGAIRAGVQTDLDSPDTFGNSTTASIGVGVKYRFAQLDYAYERHPVLAPTHFLSVTMSYNPQVVVIKEAAIRPHPVYSSLYRHYQEHDFFDVVLRNTDPEPVTATVSLMLPKLMTVPHREEVEIPPRATQRFSFPVTFDEALFHLPEASFDSFVQPLLEVRYSRNRQEHVVRKHLERAYVAGMGKLSWSVPGMAAAFVTPADLTIFGFARGLVQRYDELLTRKFGRSNTGKAVLLFDALGVYRIRYQADEKTPFARVAEDRTAFDTVQYPSQVLDKSDGAEAKVGDCDDLTVLYASLLENLSIDTVLLEANEPGQGHIYLMFDSGVSPALAEDHFSDAGEYVEWEGRIWIPVETTLFGKPFATAWRNGAAEYRRLKARGLIEEVYVQNWLQVYKPANLPPVHAVLPAEAAIDSLLERDLEFFDERVDRMAMGTRSAQDDPNAAYEVAATYMRLGHLEKATRMLETALALDPNHHDALNAMGVVLARQERYDEALTRFHRALEQGQSLLVRMNIVLVNHLKGERARAGQLFEEVIALDDTFAELFDFLAAVKDAEDQYEIGVGYLRQLRLDEASEHFDLALRADPHHTDAVNARGVVAARRGSYGHALDLFKRAAELEPEQLGFRLNTALIHHIAGDVTRADVLYRQVLAQNDAYAGLFDFLLAAASAEESYRAAVAYLKQGELAEAVAWLDRAISASPQMADAHNTRGVVLTRMGRYRDALSMFERSMDLEPSNPGFQLNVAILHFLEGRHDMAREVYQRVVSRDDRYDGVLDFLD